VLVAAYIVCILLCYLIGSIPIGFLVAKGKGIDIRKVGSGNIGATNVIRTLGKRVGMGVLFGDILKGWLAVAVIAEAVYIFWGQPIIDLETRPNHTALQIMAGVAAILGHNFTCWLGFKGGKGVATTGGVLIAWMPITFLVVIGIWAVVFFITRYVSLGSIVAAMALPIAAWQLNGRKEMIIISGVVGALVIFQHRTNIRRLLTGTEIRFERKKK
jgi:glycerol-3-phosphate acyltransferase PlsY